jgi:filamentous hemagglutinin family protein
MSTTRKSARLPRWALMLSTALAGGMANGAMAQMPSGGTFEMGPGLTTGAITIPNANETRVSINSPGTSASAVTSVINWNTFNIDPGFGISFESNASPSVRIAVLNRVMNPLSPTIISGAINAQSNFQIWIVNSNGIVFSPSGSYSGGGLVLSTASIAAIPAPHMS